MAQTAEDRKAYQAAWYRKNKKRACKAQAAWREKHPGFQKDYARVNVLTVRAYAAAWRETHREAVQEYNARYYREKTVPKRQAARKE